MRFLTIDLSEDADGVLTLEALASTPADRHAEVLLEAQQVLAWAAAFLGTPPGPLAEGHDWDHDLQVALEDGHWHAVSLTLAVAPARAADFAAGLVAAYPDSACPAP